MRKFMKILNGLSFDVEEWFDVTLLDKKLLEAIEVEKFEIVPRSTRKILRILNKYKLKATFFVTGQVAKRYPDVVREIVESGNEVGSHGYSHRLLNNLSSKELEREISLSQEQLTKITNRKINGFRAPLNAPPKDLTTYFRLLKKHGFSYDSSIYPTKVGVFSGNNNFPEQIAKIENNFYEVPLSCISILGVKFPISGGFYIRMFPSCVYQKILDIKSKRHESLVVYLHTWEFETNYPKVIKNPLKRIIQYGNDITVSNKLELMLKKSEFTNLGKLVEVFKKNQYQQ